MTTEPLPAGSAYDHHGLSEEEVQSRLAREGPNELVRSQRRSGLAIVLDVLREPMFLLLIASSLIYALLGDTQEALMLLGMVLLVVGITFYQESKTEHALEALRDLSSPMALVIRDGEQRRIPGRDVVPEDIVVLSEGDRVAADGLLVAGPGVSVDESLLTGESVPVRKDVGGEGESAAVYAGTLVVQGQGIVRVSRTGMRTELGRIGRSLATLTTEETALRKETRRLVRVFGIWGAFLCLLVLLAYGWLRQDWMQGLLAGITLAMSVLPEEFPMVLTVFMALGAWRIAKSRVLTRRAPAIEALGAATVLCVDKTGTLTLNRMTVAQVVSPDGRVLDWRMQADETVMDDAFAEVLRVAALASLREGFDPMDRASLEAWEKRAPDGWRNKAQNSLKLYPLSKEWPVMTQVWLLEGESDYAVAAKGAPETILALCRMEPARQEAILRPLREMAQRGLRVLGVARARWVGEAFPPDPSGFSFAWAGLIGYEDPLRPDVPEAIRACRTAGIRVVMITGDHPETAASIARQAGLDNPDNLMTGALLSALSDDALADRIRSVSVFARMVPEQKLCLVNALKVNREIVAMTGDGVNDAPALKAAHIGIAMGQRGTDVAREAAHLVLLNDDFSSIVQAVRLGRRIFDNLRKAMAYIFSIHIPIAGLSLLPVLADWPLVLFPAHIAFLEMVIDPACSLAFESEASEKDVMNRPPRAVQEPLFSRWTFLEAALQGSAMLLVILIVYGFALFRSYTEADARTVAFMTLLFCNLMLITVNLSGRVSVFRMPFLKNAAYWWILVGAVAALLLILTIPAFRTLFHFSPPQPTDVLGCLLAAVLYLVLAEGVRSVAQPMGKSVAKP